MILEEVEVATLHLYRCRLCHQWFDEPNGDCCPHCGSHNWTNKKKYYTSLREKARAAKAKRELIQKKLEEARNGASS